MSTITPATNNPTGNDMFAVKETNVRPLNGNGIKLKGNAKLTPEKVDEIAHEFESQFVAQMLSSMFNTMDPKEALGGSDSEEVYDSMLINEYGKIIARTGGIGVADQVKQIMISQQEVE